MRQGMGQEIVYMTFRLGFRIFLFTESTVCTLLDTTFRP